MTTSAPLNAGHAALRRADWEAARATFTAALANDTSLHVAVDLADHLSRWRIVLTLPGDSPPVWAVGTHHESA